MKGLFYLSPVMITGLLGVLWRLKDSEHSFMEKIAPIIILYYVIMVISMETGGGGWGLGVRYTIPALPFLFCFAYPVWERFRLPVIALALYSSFLVMSVSAVNSLIPAPLTWPTAGQELVAPNPIKWSSRWLSQGMVSVNTQSMLQLLPNDRDPNAEENFWSSYNLGEVVGLRGITSLTPILLWILLACVHLACTPSQRFRRWWCR
jgi:hypothetical protein